MGKMAVEGLPLSSLTVAYYYVEYGTNLAFLSRPNENYCPEALQVLAQVRQAYPDDTSLDGDCRRQRGHLPAAWKRGRRLCRRLRRCRLSRAWTL